MHVTCERTSKRELIFSVSRFFTLAPAIVLIDFPTMLDATF